VTGDNAHPARGYSWAPFQHGNEIGLRHGAWSDRHMDPWATELVEGLLADDDVAYLRAPRWAAAVWAWARTEARVALVTEYLTDLVGAGRLGDLDDPKVSAAYRLLDRFEAAAMQRGRSVSTRRAPPSWARTWLWAAERMRLPS
jgi:hypothetical protein